MNFPIENKSPINTSMKKKINPTELESRKVFAKYWSTDGVFYYCMEINDISVCRRSIDSFVNGTKLLNAAKLTRGRRDGLLKKVSDKFVVRNGIAPLRGVWIPLHVAQDFARLENIEDVAYPLLEENLGDAFRSNPDFVKAIQKKMKKIEKKSIPLKDSVESSKTNCIDSTDDITHSLKESITTESLMNFVKSSQQINSGLSHPYHVDSISKSNSHAFKTSTTPAGFSSSKDPENFNKTLLDESVIHKDTASSTRVMTPINKIVNANINNFNAASTDVTGNTNARTVVNTPHMYGYYNMDSLKPPFDMNMMNAHIYNSTRLNQNNFVYQQSANMFGISPYTQFPAEDHYKRAFGSPMQKNYMGYIPNPHDEMLHHQHPYMMHYINHQKQYEK
ncbi:hypothetical protein ACO0R3_001695 [Hanseniaspora guilliermondii]